MRTEDGLDLKAWYAPATSTPLTIVYFHGNGDSLRTAAFVARPAPHGDGPAVALTSWPGPALAGAGHDLNGGILLLLLVGCTIVRLRNDLHAGGLPRNETHAIRDVVEINAYGHALCQPHPGEDRVRRPALTARASRWRP